ncbi:uroporphyrinogen decarboxylase [Devosia enhydra]
MIMKIQNLDSFQGDRRLPASRTGKRLLDLVLGHEQERPPVWIMRQAGRYLPEYRALRQTAGSFLDLCYTPELAAEVTLQPLRRFPLDAAILFSDILVVPDAMGRTVRFEQGEGPRLEPIRPEDVANLKGEEGLAHLAPVFETVRLVRAGLSPEKTLIGFCGSPWTVATYMIAGRGTTDQGPARLFALQHPEAFAALIDRLVDFSIAYLVEQFRAGCDVVQLFESWAMNLDEVAFAERVIAPNRRIVEGVRAAIPGAPIIGFPRGAAGLVARYVEETGVDMVGLDYGMPVDFANTALPASVGVQGNLDPLRVVVGGEQMRERARSIIAGFSGRRHIFNLGHGIVPETPIAHVEELINLVHNG